MYKQVKKENDNEAQMKAVEELATELWGILGPTAFSKLDLKGIARLVIALGYKKDE